MRLLVLALAILLLPLRGWLGDAMALEMVQQQRQQPAMHAMHAMNAMNAMAPDHASHAAHADASHSDPQPSAAQPDCQNTCGNCQLCHSVAMSLLPALPAFNAAPRQAPAFRPAGFASAEPAASFKPPIF